MTPCAACQVVTDDLALFPGGICLECYKQTPEANAPLSADDVVRMWGGPANKNTLSTELTSSSEPGTV